MTSEQTSIDYLPSYCRARVLVLGVGNILFGDDGFGPAVIENLLQRYTLPDDIYTMDAGTGVRKLLFTLTLSSDVPDEIVIIDAVDWGNEIGQVMEIPADALPATKQDDFSLHQVPTSNMLKELQEQHGIKVTAVVCDVGDIPQIIQPGLSPAVASAVPIASQLIAVRLDLRARRKSNITACS
jgi:coenzyme F420 hydrogenase subunit delta